MCIKSIINGLKKVLVIIKNFWRPNFFFVLGAPGKLHFGSCFLQVDGSRRFFPQHGGLHYSLQGFP